EDGIRDFHVTGVQTCALPIYSARLQALSPDERRKLWIRLLRSLAGADLVYMKSVPQLIVGGVDLFAEMGQARDADILYRAAFQKIGRASCRERAQSEVVTSSC